jgi:predicted ArsR family transcriptional regulator
VEPERITPTASRRRRIKAITALADPARLALYELMSKSTEPLSRDAAAAAVGLPRSTVAFHLDRLADVGLLEVRYRRLSGRDGPGAGRPSKLYGRADTEVSVSLPERHYDLLGEILASAIEESADSGSDVHTALRGIAHEHGRELAYGSTSLRSALEDSGYEPLEDDGDVVFGNCPFHTLAQRHTELVCHLNRALVEGMRSAVPDGGGELVTDPQAGRCCVRITGAAGPESIAGEEGART